MGTSRELSPCPQVLWPLRGASVVMAGLQSPLQGRCRWL